MIDRLRGMGRYAAFAFTSLVAGLASMASCGDGEGSSSSGTVQGGTGGAGGNAPSTVPCDSAPAELSLSGIWAAYGRLSVKLLGVPGGAITICPEDQIGESTMLLLVTVKQDPNDKTKISEASAVLCSMELPVVTALVGQCDPASPTLVSTQIEAPDSFISALPKIAAPPVAGTLDGLAKGAVMTLDPFTVTAGTSKSGGAMPKWDVNNMACLPANLGRADCEVMCVDDCAAMRDDDGDTYPGMTMNVCGKTPDDVKNGVKCNAEAPNEPGTTLQGRAFLNLEVTPKLSGTAVSSCELSGTVDSDVLYNVVGADVYLTGGQIGVTSAIKSLPTFDVDPTLSKFRMIRIDGQYGAPNWAVDPSNASAACAVLNQRVNEI